MDCHVKHNCKVKEQIQVLWGNEGAERKWRMCTVSDLK